MRKLLILKAVLILIVGIIFIPTSRNFILRKSAEKILSNEYYTIKIEDLESSHKRIEIKNAHIIMKKHTIAILDYIDIKFSLREIWRKKMFAASIDIKDTGKIFGEKASIISHTDFLVKSFNEKEFSVNIKEISSPISKKFGIGDITGNCHISWREEDIFVDKCRIDDDSSDFMFGFAGEFDGDSTKSLALSGKIKELPVDIHKGLHAILPQNEILDYLNESISGSLIKNGSWDIYLPADFFKSFKVKPEYIAGNFHIENLDYKYDPDFPELKNIKADLNILGSELDFKLISAMSNDTKLSDGKIHINWANPEDADVVAKAKSNGPTRDLTDYIPSDVMNDLKESDLDISKFTGTAKGYVNIVIPTNSKPNKYDIKVVINNAGVSIFDDNVTLSRANLKGAFDGETVKISGKGLVNGFKSDIEFINYLEDTGPFDNMLKLKTRLARRETFEGVPLFEVDTGNTIVDIMYKDKAGKKHFSADGDLTDVSLNISKLGIYNNKGDKAKLKIKGESKNSNEPLELNVSLKGDNIDVEGITNLSSNITKIHFPKIKSNDTVFSADVEIKPQLIIAKINGKLLDLSRSNMIGFLSKDTSGNASDIKINFDAIKLKNDIYLDHFKLDIECGKEACSTGYMFANVGTRELEVKLHPNTDFEEWRIRATNAGAILKGFGIIDNIKAGDLSINLKTNIRNATRGKIIPIAEGDFKMEKFVTVDNKFLTRLVSNLSLPGLLNIITNSNDISFREMTSKFDYVDGVINIIDGQANGVYMDLTIKGQIDTKNREVKIKGRVTPPIYGVKSIFNKIPVLGRIFGRKGKAGLISAPYTIEEKY